jgi:hypothetical protein
MSETRANVVFVCVYNYGLWGAVGPYSNPTLPYRFYELQFIPLRLNVC